jgi:hypothetical protein
MIIYNVTVKINTAVADEWLQWMKAEHIPQVMSTGLFLENHIFKVLVDEPDGLTYSMQYLCRTMSDYEKYRIDHAPALQSEMLRKYKDHFVAFRTLLELVA